MTTLNGKNLIKIKSEKGKSENDASGKGNLKKDKYEQEKSEKEQFRK